MEIQSKVVLKCDSMFSLFLLLGTVKFLKMHILTISIDTRIHFYLFKRYFIFSTIIRF